MALLTPFGHAFGQSTSSKKFQNSTISKNWLLGKINYKKNPNFVVVRSLHASRSGLYLHKGTYAAFQKMYNAAQKSGISLNIISAARSFKAQKAIWEAKWNGRRRVNGLHLNKKFPNKLQRARIILKYSSMPQTSRHHWGSEIDLNSLENSYFKKGYGLKVYNWLKKNARHFGFCQVYSAKDKNRPHGYEEERWHWSYLKLARKLHKMYRKKITHRDIQNFSGAKLAKKLKIIPHYVNGINPRCR